MDFKSSKMSGKSSFEKVTYCMIPRIQWKERTKFFLPSCSHDHLDSLMPLLSRVWECLCSLINLVTASPTSTTLWRHLSAASHSSSSGHSLPFQLVLKGFCLLVCSVFWPCHKRCRILVPWRGIELVPLTVEARPGTHTHTHTHTHKTKIA